MNEQARHIVCPHCDSLIRIPPQKPAEQAQCARCPHRLFAGRSFPLSTKSFATHIQHNDIPVVVDFWAEWCGPCKAMAPVYERVAAELEPAFRFVNVDTEAEPELAARSHIRSIPTLMLFHKGSVVAQRAGAVDAPTLRSWLRAHAASSPSATGLPADRVCSPRAPCAIATRFPVVTSRSSGTILTVINESRPRAVKLRI